MTYKVFLLVSLLFFSCSKKASTTYEVDPKMETVQQLGESMAAIDEAGGYINGDIVKSKSLKPFNEPEFAVQSNSPLWISQAVPPVFADACVGNDYSTCSSNQKIRNLTGCTTSHGAVVKGAVTLTYYGSAATSCTVPVAGDYVTRSPNIGISGIRGATFGITGGLQTLTRTGATTFTYADSGTRRRFIGPDGKSLLDLTVTTSGTVTLTGSSRAGRTLTGGSFMANDALNSVSCEFVPSGIAWGAGCNCPTGGSLAATCSDASTLSMNFSGTCGEVSMINNSVSSTVYMDRCE